MAGCEYLPSIPGIGLKVAIKHMEKYKSIDKIIEFLKSKKADKVPENYIEALN